MGSWIRTVLMWMLVVALPVQGWAAASMLSCGPSHHRIAAASAEADDHAGGVHHNAVQGSRADAEDGLAGHHADGAHHVLDKLSKFKCSACATCCTAFALPATMLTFDTTHEASFIAPRLPQADAVFQTGGPERPPRPIFA